MHAWIFFGAKKASRLHSFKIALSHIIAIIVIIIYLLLHSEGASKKKEAFFCAPCHESLPRSSSLFLQKKRRKKSRFAVRKIFAKFYLARRTDGKILLYFVFSLDEIIRKLMYIRSRKWDVWTRNETLHLYQKIKKYVRIAKKSSCLSTPRQIGLYILLFIQKSELAKLNFELEIFWDSPVPHKWKHIIDSTT